MKREFIKTVVLTCLVISSLVLSAHIWYEKELWSLDYSSFVHSSENLFVGGNSESPADADELLYWSEFSPEFISLTYGSQKNIIYQASPDFPEVNRMAEEIVASIEKDGSLSTITAEEYLNAYKTNSMMLKFPARVNLTEFLRQEDAFFDAVANPVSDTLVIGVGDSQTNHLTFMDVSSGRAYQMPVKITVDAAAIEKQVLSANKNDSYAFELNFDTNAEDTERILFERFVPIVLEPTGVQKIHVEPVSFSSAYDGVFKAFRIVKNSARTYRDKTGVINFIENRSTLKINEEGAFHFEATDLEAGIGLSKRSQKEAVTEFVNLLYRSMVPGSDGYLRVLTSYTEGSKTVYEFWYYTPNGALYQQEKPAVRVVCQNGTIVEYDQTVLRLVMEEGTETVSGVIEAYDYLYNQPDFSEKSNHKIESMFPCYALENGELSAGWFCRFSDDSVTFIKP